MRRGAALAAVALMATATATALAAPWPAALGVLGFALAGARRRTGLAWLAASTVAIDAALLALASRDPPVAGPSWLPLSGAGALLGAELGLRTAAAVAANVAALQAWTPARLVEGLRPPRRATAVLAAILLAASAVGEDARRLVAARRLDGAWPTQRLARVRAGGRLVAPLLAAGLARARTRQEALRGAGLAMPAAFAPFVAVAALAAAGRLAFLAVPNVALTYVVVFAGGILFGPCVGAAAGAASMAVTDVMLSGLLPAPFVNVAAMALVGALGGWMRGLDWGGAYGSGPSRRSAVALAAATGFLATMAFSAASDALTWLLVPGLSTHPEALRALVVAGLAFNVLPGVANAVLFAVAAPPAVRAWRATSSAGSPKP